MKTLTTSIVKSNEYFTTRKVTDTTIGRLALPNCTTFAYCAWHWVFNAQQRYTLFNGWSAGNFGNAKLWYSTYKFSKGSTPKVAAIACWDGSKYNGDCGHVAFVKSFVGNKITVYQSNYGGTYFEERTYTVQVGATTQGVGAKFLGFCYHPYYSEENSETTSTKTLAEIAQEVIDGKWGNGNNRKIRLEAAGYNYSEVQAEVNKLLANKNTSSKKSIEEIAKEVIAGSWGTFA